jgi:very-short-patch-repair endonuclease
MKKKTKEEVVSLLRQEGYELISSFENTYSRPLITKCPNGHTYKMWFSGFVQGVRCPCKSNRTYWTLEQIREEVEKRGYTLLSDKYKGNVKLILRCREGHIWNTFWNAFRYHKNANCPLCVKEKRKYTHEHVNSRVEKRGYKLLSKYIGHGTRMKIECPKGHQYKTTWSVFYQGSDCPECNIQNRRNTLDDIRQRVECEGYILLSQIYKNNKTKLIMQCPQGHICKIAWSNFQLGVRCPLDGGEPRGEKHLRKILEQLYPDENIVRQDHFDFLGQQRVDFSIRVRKLAFEYDGKQHFEPLVGPFGCKTKEEAQRRFEVQRKQDCRKDKLCQENGYTLIRFSYEEEITLESVKQKIESSERDLKCLR